MAEKRKPTFVLLLKKQGKKANKIELFDARMWKDKINGRTTLIKIYGSANYPRFRVRAGGVWYNYNDVYRYTFLTMKEIKDLTWRSIGMSLR